MEAEATKIKLGQVEEAEERAWRGKYEEKQKMRY